MRSDPRRPRVFIGLREVAGVGRGLKAGFDELGVESVFLDIGYHPFRYTVANNPAWARRLSAASAAVGRYFTGGWLKRVLWIGFVQSFFSALAFPWALLRYDAFVYCSVGTFFFFLELPVLRLFRKKVIFIFLGSDSRPVYLNGYVIAEPTGAAVKRGLVLARVQQAVIRIIDRYADVVVNIPPQAHFHTRPVVSGYHVGLPAHYRHAEARDGTMPERVRILHAPSKPGPKGTERIRQVIAALREKGLPFDYVEVTGRPHAEVLAEIQRSSFVIDELYSDTPMAGFATEAAYFGRPAVVGSYYASQIGAVLKPADMPPSVFCLPDDLERWVERMIVDRGFREELGRRAGEFVRERWAASHVAAKYLRLIEGDIPREWIFDPKGIRYVEGCGLRRDRGAAVLRGFVEAGGASSLRVRDKPELEALFLARANEVAPATAHQPG